MANSMEVIVSSTEDYDSVWSLIQEAGDHSDRLVGKEDLRNAAFGDEKLLKLILVKNKKQEVMGVASIFDLYSTWEGPFLFIDEFLIHPQAEGKDVDLVLLKKTVQDALASGCCRLQFYINRSDTSLLERYKALGAISLEEWFTVRLPNTAVLQLANGINNFKGPYSIRCASKDDVPSILYLIQCLAEFEKEPDSVKIDEKVLLETGFGAKSYYQCLIAESDGSIEERTPSTITNGSLLLSSTMPRNPHIVAMALYHNIYCKRRGKVFHLEDLYVKEEHRGKGLGVGLIRECAKIAISNGCSEMDWQVLDWNTKAIDFYKSLGGVILKDSLIIRFTRDGMTRLI